MDELRYRFRIIIIIDWEHPVYVNIHFIYTSTSSNIATVMLDSPNATPVASIPIY